MGRSDDMPGTGKEAMRRVRNAGLLAAAASFVLAVAAEAVAPPPSRKMMRQIEVMEKIIDQVLHDSPNYFIRSLPVARGSYIPEFGVLFTFDASLVRTDWDKEVTKWSIPGFRVENQDGRKVIILDKDWEDEEDSDSTDVESSDDEDFDPGDWRDIRRRRQERVYLRGKTEMVQVLLDYGDTLTSLDDGKWVAIMAFLTDEDFINRNRISRLILKAKIDDLREYGSGSISEEEMVKRIVEQEY
jgi:hypothetical protein